jgi:hypothetical protein
VVNIIGTPFKSKNILVGKRTNKLIKKRIRISGINKRDIKLKNIRDKIGSKNLPKSSRPGAIE